MIIEKFNYYTIIKFFFFIKFNKYNQVYNILKQKKIIALNL